MSKEVIANNYETSHTSSCSDWLANMPEEIRKAESLGKFKDVSSLAHSYLEAEKSLNQRVAVPKDDSSDEALSKKLCKFRKNRSLNFVKPILKFNHQMSHSFIPVWNGHSPL
ncbi:MAG: hypothetical protein DMENIID0002_03190 [Rickettsia endosymbiont of Sergentomyia squamirostris]|uniref:Uncharacterized protein n=1 Tax=Candidatus Tisiphia endosymbiont of Sergentomyia squamirostris TaxID=3113639 RepID=A0AAT9G7B7_9RICK